VRRARILDLFRRNCISWSHTDPCKQCFGQALTAIRDIASIESHTVRSPAI
jgi:hypothetical protein